jgi:hypothetical protein
MEFGKIEAVALAVLAYAAMLLGPVTAASALGNVLAPDSPEWYRHGEGRARLEYSAVEARLYHYDIRPVTPAQGITRGYVFAYGHPLARPYRFEIRSDTLLMVNGVQVNPWLRLPAVAEAESAHTAALRANSLYSRLTVERWRGLASACDSIIRALWALQGMTDSAVVDTLRAYLGTQHDVGGVHAGVADGIVYHFLVMPTDGGGPPLPSGIFHKQRTPAPPEFPPSPDSVAGIRGRRLALLRDVREDSTLLEQGMVLMFGGEAGGRYGHATLGKLLRYVTAESLGWSARARLLTDSVFHYADAAKSLLYNYEASEYGTLNWGEQ